MKLTLLYILLLIMPFLSLSAQDDGIHIKDSVLLKAILLNGVDKDTNNIISIDEANAVDTLILKNLNIRNIDDIKYFEGLKYLDCSHNKLTEIDLSNNPFLEELNCSFNKLKSLDLTMNGQLRSLVTNNNYPSFYVVYTYHDEKIYKEIIPIPDSSLLAALIEVKLDQDLDGQISFEESEKINSLNLSGKGIRNIEGLQFFLNLIKLDLSNNELDEINLDGLRELQNLNLFKNNLTSLKLDKLNKLKYLTTSFNPITELNLSKNLYLVYLNCTANRLAVLNVWDNTKLKQIKSDGNHPTLKIYYTRPEPISKKKKKKKK